MQSADPDSVVDQLMRQLQALQAQKQRWKRIALSAVVFLVVGLLCGIILTAGGGIIYWGTQQRHSREIEAAEEAVRAALQEVEELKVTNTTLRGFSREMARQLSESEGKSKAAIEKDTPDK